MRHSRFFIALMTLLSLSVSTVPINANSDSSKVASGTVQNIEAKVPGEEWWKQFRETYPFHIQTLAFHKESRTLIIAEPPPHVTLESLKEAIQQYSPTLNVTMHVKSTKFGVDGWVKDIVLQLPSMDDGQTKDIFDSIQQHLFHTTYKSYVVSLPTQKPAPNSDNLDLNVSVGEVNKWLFENKETLSTIFGDRSQTAHDLLTKKKDGVFFSKDRGLVIWSLNKTKQFSDSLAEARQFSLDSDLIVSAVNSGDQILIVGRERVVPVEILPPLRVETIELLASIKDDELAQSYERGNVYAGRFNDSEDWAPIYLSDSLIDTEFGSLLNITDQILKGWSMNGSIDYTGFKDYPNPRVWGKNWCFNNSLFEAAKAENLTFNWNTQGVGYTNSYGNREIFALNRSGSLPTSYLEGDDQKPSYSSYEESGYQCFATFGDPNLARVVQYTALYQIFQKFPITGDLTWLTEDAPFSSPENILQTPDDILTREALGRIKATLRFSSQRVAEISASLSPQARKILTEHRAAFEHIENLHKESGLRELAGRITHQRLSQAERNQALEIQEEYNRLTPQLKAVLPLGFVDPRLSLRVRRWHIWNDVLETVYTLSKSTPGGTKTFFFAPKDKLAELKTTYKDEFKVNPDSWIHTPSIVISHPTRTFFVSGKEIVGVGGHNVDAETTNYKTSTTVPRGTIRTLRAGRRLTFLLNPADVGKIPALVRRTAFLNKTYKRTPQSEAGIRLSLQKFLNAVPLPQPPRAIKAAFQVPAEPLPYRGFKGEPGVGWRVESNDGTPIAREIQNVAKHGDVAVLIDRQATAGGFEYTITSREGKVVKAGSIPSAIDAVVGFGRNAAVENPKVAFHLKGFTENEAQGFLYNTDLRLRNNDLTGFVEPIGTANIKKAGDYNFPGVTVGEHSLMQITEGRYKGLHELTINFDVPAPVAVKPPLKIRLQMFYKNAVSNPTVSGLKSTIKNFFNKPVSPESGMDSVIFDLANELRTTNPDTKNILTVWKEDSSGIFIVELRRPQNDDENSRQSRKSE